LAWTTFMVNQQAVVDRERVESPNSTLYPT
jgi:hypothetical protein